MFEAGVNKPGGGGKCNGPFAKWARLHPAFEPIDQADRRALFECLKNLDAIDAWRAGLSPAQLLKWNYPPIGLWRTGRRARGLHRRRKRPPVIFPG